MDQLKDDHLLTNLLCLLLVVGMIIEGIVLTVKKSKKE